MESHLQENFDVRSKHSSAEVLERWRNLCGVVKNPKRRFRFTANLSKRHEADAVRKTNQEKLKIAVLVSKAAIQFHIVRLILFTLFCFVYALQSTFKANAPSPFPDTKSSTPLLSGTEINQEAHHIRNDSSQKDSTEEENIDNIHPSHGSPTESECFSCTDVDKRKDIRKKDNFEANAPSPLPETKSSTPFLPKTEINHEAHHIRNDSSEKYSIKEENIDDIHPSHGSPTDFKNFSRRDVDLRTNIRKKDNFEANAPSSFPETKISAPLLPETEINHVSHHKRNDSSQKDGIEEENIDDIHPSHGSPTDSEYFSCTDIDQRRKIRLKDNFKANAPSPFPETKSSTPLLPETEINHVSHRIRNDSSEQDSTEEENIDDNHPPHGSPTDSEYFSCTDVDQRTNIRLKKLELSVVVANLVCEVSTVIFDQLSSPHKSLFALIATLTSFFTVGFCIIEICCKCSQGKYVWNMEGKFYWFYNAGDGKPFGSVLDIIGIVSGTLQFILTAVAYGIYYSQHVNSPIKLHICSIVFAFVLLCSKISVEKQKTWQHFESSEC
ncbi:hypothetical protein Patl1_35043 [Pistacia atlantica]|uniref:Uncharacterized protein n=1 Tax=Pistacia atlantica TaxID=434234 RepID=A0ACC0ZS26_9ROSI|nr:hypothetical protein Patl1_35043 [Pistacia atlantica]